MKKHTNLWNEVYHGKKPDLTWLPVAIGVTVMIAACGLIYLGMIIMSV